MTTNILYKYPIQKYFQTTGPGLFFASLFHSSSSKTFASPFLPGTLRFRLFLLQSAKGGRIASHPTVLIRGISRQVNARPFAG